MLVKLVSYRRVQRTGWAHSVQMTLFSYISTFLSAYSCSSPVPLETASGAEDSEEEYEEAQGQETDSLPLSSSMNSISSGEDMG